MGAVDRWIWNWIRYWITIWQYKGIAQYNKVMVGKSAEQENCKLVESHDRLFLSHTGPALSTGRELRAAAANATDC